MTLARALIVASLAHIPSAFAGAGSPVNQPITGLAVTGQPTLGSGGAPISVLNNPFLTRDGRVAFVGAIDPGTGNNHFVWFDGGIVWLNSDALPVVLVGGETTMGISDNGDWVYSPSQDSLDAVWVNGASLFKETDPAPGLPGQYLTFCSRPQMDANGTPTWVSGTSPVQGGGAFARALYQGGVKVLASGETIDGQLITSGPSVGFPYDFSTDGSEYIVKVTISAPSTSNDVVILSGSILARESFPTGFGGNWQNFGDMKVNNAGDWALSGDTDAGTSEDGFLVLNSTAVARESFVLGLGITLTGNPLAVGLNDLGQVGAIWNSSAGELLFVITPGPKANDLNILMRVGDDVDLDGDGNADGTISDFTANTTVGPGLDLPRQCRVCAHVDVTLVGGAVVEAIVCTALPSAPGLADLSGDGLVNGKDLAILLGLWGLSGIADIDCDGVVTGGDLAILLGAWSV
ncbi:MAG: hypothetical protein SGJ09_00360 [Phycisphaerae bacterium]|nr:hypothetical protein [Phycisphaerae bacterium]